MVIAIDLTSLSYHITGIERYALCISESILLQDNRVEYILIFRAEIYSTFVRYIDGKRVKAKILHGNNKLIFNQLVLPMKLYGIKADIFLFLAFSSPILFWKKGIITTIHDMGAWDYSQALSLLQKIYYRAAFTASAFLAETILTVSEFSKGRICEILKMKNSDVHVVPSAITASFSNDCKIPIQALQKKYGLPEKYIMTLSTLEPRKNMKLLLDAFIKVEEKVDFDVVLVGRKGWKIDELINEIDQQNRIHLTGFVEDEDVIGIYKNAMCFVFPTAYEGFGLPPVEALALGTPVLSSDAASMTEVLRGQASYFESGNQEELEKKLLTMKKDIKSMPTYLDEYQLENYRFDVSARKILNIIYNLRK